MVLTNAPEGVILFGWRRALWALLFPGTWLAQRQNECRWEPMSGGYVVEGVEVPRMLLKILRDHPSREWMLRYDDKATSLEVVIPYRGD